jgi:hypothetical protein
LRVGIADFPIKAGKIQPLAIFANGFMCPFYPVTFC